jgi:molecular chaperone DnaJ
MPYKDYYAILNIPSSASTEEIKKAFRKLALQYHPDKHKDGGLVVEKFLEIKEAYLILKDKAKRSAYHYQRYTQDPLSAKKPLAQTDEEILQSSIHLYKKISTSDPFRIDFDLLCFEIKDLLSNHHLHILQSADNTIIKEKFIRNILEAARVLPLHSIISIITLMRPLSKDDPLAVENIAHYLHQIKWQHYWNRYKIYIALLLAILFCMIVYFSDKSAS